MMESAESISISNDILLGEASRLLSMGKDVIIKAKGSSMLPYIRDGKDSVKLRKKEILQIGDIVLAEVAEGVYVIHRIFSIDGERIVLMGDGNLGQKERCLKYNIKGTVIEIIDPKEKPHAPGKGRFWRLLLPFRRILLGIYRRTLLKL